MQGDRRQPPGTMTPRVVRDPALAIRNARRMFFDRGIVPWGLVRDRVLASWRRCVALGLDPADPPDHDGVRRDVLDAALERNNVLMRAAKPVIAAMAAHSDGDPSVVVLTDSTGLILMTAGNRQFAAYARRREARAGTTLDESVRGTNAPGTCLRDGEPVIVSGAEHYLARDACFACSAAPIHGPRGDVVGSIDVTGDARVLQPNPVAFPRMAAELIEHRLFREGYPLHLLLRFHTHPEYIGALGEGLAVLASDGTLVAVNRAGVRLLRLDGARLPGRAFDSVFDARFAELCGVVERAVQPVIRLYLQSGARIYARLEGGDLAPAVPVGAVTEVSRAGAGAPSLKQIESDAVRHAIDAEKGNLSAAARRLGVARSTLYRKLKKRGAGTCGGAA